MNSLRALLHLCKAQFGASTSRLAALHVIWMIEARIEQAVSLWLKTNSQDQWTIGLFIWPVDSSNLLTLKVDQLLVRRRKAEESNAIRKAKPYSHRSPVHWSANRKRAAASGALIEESIFRHGNEVLLNYPL